MSAARFFGMHVMAYCQVVWPDDLGMAKHDAVAAAISFSIFTDSGSHKYIPADRLSTELGMQPGNGVFQYYKFPDGSYLLLCCNGQLASWDGEDSKPRIIESLQASEFRNRR